METCSSLRCLNNSHLLKSKTNIIINIDYSPSFSGGHMIYSKCRKENSKTMIISSKKS